MRTPALFFDEKNIKYFTGVGRTNGLLLVTGSKKYFLTSDAEAASNSSSKITVIKVQKDSVKEMGLLLRKLRVKKLYSPVSAMTVKQHDSLKKIAKLEDNTDEISELRAVKTKEEITKMKKACEYADEAMKAAKDAIRIGVTEKRVRNEAMGAILDRCEDDAFPMIVASGVNSMMTHGYPTDKKIKEKETIIVDLGFTFDGYCSDLTRTFAINPTEKQSALYNVVMKAYDKSMASLKEGRKYSEIYDVAARVFDESKTRQFWKYSLGHGVGLDIHEMPFINAKQKMRVKNGNVFTIEPGLHVKGVGGCRIEDTVLFEKKPIALTRFPKEFEL